MSLSAFGVEHGDIYKAASKKKMSYDDKVAAASAGAGAAGGAGVGFAARKKVGEKYLGFRLRHDKNIIDPVKHVIRGAKTDEEAFKVAAQHPAKYASIYNRGKAASIVGGAALGGAAAYKVARKVQQDKK